MAKLIPADIDHQNVVPMPTNTFAAHTRRAMARAIKNLAEERGAFDTVNCDDLRALGFTESEITTHSNAAKGLAMRDINFTPVA